MAARFFSGCGHGSSEYGASVGTGIVSPAPGRGMVKFNKQEKRPVAVELVGLVGA